MSYIFNRLNFLMAVALTFILALTGNEIIKYAQNQQRALAYAHDLWFVQPTSVHGTQDRCQELTRYICTYESCQNVAGEPSTEPCDRNSKPGWRATNIPIPEFFLGLQTIVASQQVASSTTTYTLDAAHKTLAHSSTSGFPSEPRSLTINDLTQLLNTLILNELGRTSVSLPMNANETRLTLVLSSTNPPPSIAIGTDLYTVSYSCSESNCPRSIIDTLDTIRQLSSY